mmetsp:Transcript_19350/g.28615  ORF Transcript_19350/g.28615 Transcript_19350/m.28615 type:complete len:294 (+) Transcript_19350:433-1314(+)
MSEARRGHRKVIDHAFPAANILDGADAVRARSVRQHHDSVRVSDAVNVWHHISADAIQNLHFFVDLDEAAVRFDVQVLEAQVFGVWSTASGDHACVHFQRFHVFFRRGVDHFYCDRSLARNTGYNLAGKYIEPVIDTARLDQNPLRQLRDLPVKRRHQIRHSLDESNFSAQSRINVRKLQANVPGTDDRCVLRHELKFQPPIGGKNSFIINLNSRGHEWDAARGQNDVSGSVHFVSAFDFVFSDQNAEFFDQFNSQTFQRGFQVPFDFVGEVFRVVGDCLAIVGNVSVHFYAE